MLTSLRVSVQNCNITIMGFGRFAATQSAGILSYNVTGQGTQTVNLGFGPKNREWSVILNDEFLPTNQGWSVANDGTVTITRSAVNVTIFYLDYPEDIDSSNQPFYQQHSVAIVSTVLFAVVVVLAVVIRVKTRKANRVEGNK